MTETHTSTFDPAKVWDYSTRTLTTTKFPFWEGLVYSSSNSTTVAAGGSATVDIQPPTGEDWLIFLYTVLETNASDSMIGICEKYSGVPPSGIPWWAHKKANANFGEDYISLTWIGLAYSGKCPRIKAINKDSSDHYLRYYYTALNLGTKKVEVQPAQAINLLPLEEKAETIPKVLEPLKNRIVIRRDFPEAWGKPVLAVKLVDGKPLAKLPSGHIVERLHVIVPADRLIQVIKGIKAGEIDPIRSGWAQYLKYWKKPLGLEW